MMNCGCPKGASNGGPGRNRAGTVHDLIGHTAAGFCAYGLHSDGHGEEPRFAVECAVIEYPNMPCVCGPELIEIDHTLAILEWKLR